MVIIIETPIQSCGHDPLTTIIKERKYSRSSNYSKKIRSVSLLQHLEGSIFQQRNSVSSATFSIKRATPRKTNRQQPVKLIIRPTTYVIITKNNHKV